MRNKNIALIGLIFKKGAILFPIFFLSLSLLVFSFFPEAAWAAAPTAPTNLIATAASSRQISLSWQDNATNEANYYVERAPAAKGTWKVVATLGANVTSYQDTGLTQNTTYYYQVRCKAGSTYSSYSNTSNAMTATLAAPTGFTASVISASSIGLAWTDNAAYESNYSVERSPNGSSSWTVIATLGANVTTYTNTGLIVGTAYYFRVRAYDGTNYSAYSAVINQTIRTITASAGANGAISPSGTVGVANGSTQVFTITPNTGYKIATVTVDGGAVATNPTYTFSNITANHTIAVTFSVSAFTITASVGANGSISPSGIVSVNAGATTTFTMTPNTGYHVADVLVDGASVGAVGSYTFTNVTADHTIITSFAINTYTVTASAGANGSISPLGTVSINSGQTMTFTMTPNTDYHVSDVLVDGASVGALSMYSFTNVTANHTISASFAINADTYDITASAGDNGTISPSGVVSVNSGATTTFTITPNTGYGVSDVLVDGSSVGSRTSYTFTNVTANHTIAASFVTNSYTITATAGANGTIFPSGSRSVNSGSNARFTITPNTGYRISDVIVDTVSVGTPTIYTFNNITANHAITASFAAANTLTINTTSGSGGSISPTGAVSVNYGASQNFIITPNNRYTIVDVTVDGVSQGAQTSITFVNVTANHTIAATFASNSRAITIAIDTPSKNTTINRPDIMVTGTVTNADGNETGVIVNGIAANIYGNQFVANHVPLIAGTNTITAIATDINGRQSSDVVTVTALVSGYYASLTATTVSGIAPLVTTLQIDGPFSITTSTITVNGPGQPTFLSSSSDTYQVQMTPEGIYYFTASVTGPDGNTYQDKIGVVAMNATALDNLLRGKWNAMVSSLSNKDIPTALKYISPTTRSIYQQMYTAVVNQLPAMVATQTGLNFISINNNTAFYDLVTSENGVTAKYEVIFIKDTNGLWIIQDF